MNVSEELSVPVALISAAQNEGRQDWLATLPATVRRLEALWSIDVAEPFQPGGMTAWVAPVRRGTEELVVKVLWRHYEAEHEADGLRAWRGRGAVRLLAASDIDTETTALLLERCRPGTSLRCQDESEQDRVIAGLLRQLWIEPPAGHRFRPLRSMCGAWADEFDAKTAGVDQGLDPGLVRAAITLYRELPSSAETEVLLCTDLHAGNVLSAERQPWLVIDPKPYVGDSTYDALQHMLNCGRRLRADPHDFVRRMASLLDLDPERLLLWLFARCVQESPDWPGMAEVARKIAPR